MAEEQFLAPDEGYPRFVSPEVQAERDRQAAALKTRYEGNPAYEGTAADTHVIEDQVARIAGGKKKTEQFLAPDLHEVSYLAPDSVTPKEEQYLPPDENKVETPSTLKIMGQSILNTAGGLVKGAGFLGAPIADAMYGTEGYNAVMDAAKAGQKALGSALLTPEEQAQANLAQKTAGGFAGGAAYMAAGKLAMPLMTAEAGVSTLTDMIEKGVSTKRAIGAALVDASAAAATALVGSTGGTWMKSMLLGGGTNVVSGTASDVVIHEMFPDRADIQKERDPLNWEKRVVEFGSGAGMGLAAHGIKATGEKIASKNQERVDRDLADRVLPEISSLFAETKDRYVPDEGNTHRNAIIQSLNEGRVDGVSLKKYVNLIAADEKAPTHFREMAERISRVADELGLDDLKVHTRDILQDEEGKVGGSYFHEPTERFGESWAGDTIAIKTKKVDQQIKTILHEALHAISYKGVDLLDKYDNSTIRNAPAAEQALYSKATKLKDIFERARDQYIKERFATPQEIYDQARAKNDSKKMNESYGFTNLHEFVSETLTNPEFGTFLKNMKVSRDIITRDTPSTPRLIKNFWQAAKKSLMSMVGMTDRDNMHSLAFDHITGMLDDVSGITRHIKSAEIAGKQADIRDQFNAKASVSAKALTRKISNILKEVSTKDELAWRLSAVSKSKAWRDWVAQNTDKLWDNTNHFLKATEKSDFSKLPEAMQKLADDDRTIDEFIHEEFEKYVSEGKVHTKLFSTDDLEGTGRRLFSPTVLNNLKSGPGAKVMRWVNSKANQYKDMTAILYEDATSHFKHFNELPRKQQLALADTIAMYEGMTGRKMLMDRKVQWIPEDLLRERKLDDATIQAYQNMTRGLDFLHSMLNQALIKQGKEPLKQIPGYMPHVWDGAYKVLVTKIDQETGKELVVHVKGFNWRQSAEKFVKELDSGKYDTDGAMYRSTIDPVTGQGWRVRKHEDLKDGLMSGIQEHIDSYNNFAQLEPEAVQALEKIDRDVMRGMTKHILERSNVGGYRGEGGTRNDILERLKIGSPVNNKILTLWQNYAKSVTEYYRNTLFVDEVASRLTNVYPIDLGGKTAYYTLFENTKELQHHLTEMGYNFTGENLNHFKVVDEYLQKKSIEIGIDPLAYRKVTRLMRNFLSMIKLRANPGNYIANVAQPMNTLALLHWVNASLQKDRHEGPLPDPMRAMSRMITRNLKPDPHMQEALDWAKDKGILDASMEYELHSKQLSPLLDILNTGTLGKVNASLESFGRRNTFMMAFEHMRNIYPHDTARAREAARSIMEMTMVNYDHASRPLMYQNFGVVGEALSPFAVFRNAYVGNTLLMGKLMAKGGWKNMNMMKPLLVQQLTFLGLAGAVGMLGAAEYNAISQQLNKWFPETLDLPTLEEFLYKQGVPDWMTFGVLSASTKGLPGLEHGVYVGSSLNAVGMDDTFSSAMLPFAKALASVAGISVEAVMSLLTDGEVLIDNQNLYKAGKQLIPGWGQGYWDKYFMAKGTNVAPKTSNVYEGGYQREESDWRAIDWFGRRSLTETTESNQNRIISQTKQQAQAGIKKMVEAAVNHMLDLPNGLEPSQARARAIQLSGNEPDFSSKFDQMVAEARIRRLVSQKDQEARLKGYEGAKARAERARMMGY